MSKWIYKNIKNPEFNTRAETMQAQIEAAHSRRLYKDFLRRFAVM